MCGMAWALSPDATREQVIAELGKPTSVAKLGGREILSYPNGVRLELEGGKVVAAKGLALSDSATARAEPAATPQTPGNKTPAVTEKEKAKTTEEAEMEHEFEQGKTKAQMDIEKTVEGIVSSHEKGQQPAAPPAFNFLGLAFELGVKFLLTVAALKLACKYWGAEVFWSGILIVAAADVAVRGAIGLFGSLVLGFPTVFYADEAAGAIVMVILLKKLSINHAIAQAIEVTTTTKTFTIVVGSFLVTILLRLMH